MEVLNKIFNILGELIDSLCPSGIKAGDLGPNSGFMLYVLGDNTLAGVILVSGMMAGYTFRLVQELVHSQTLADESEVLQSSVPQPSDNLPQGQSTGVGRKPGLGRDLENDKSFKP